VVIMAPLLIWSSMRSTHHVSTPSPLLLQLLLLLHRKTMVW
jgi:hypothetical protein